MSLRCFLEYRFGKMGVWGLTHQMMRAILITTKVIENREILRFFGTIQSMD